jgi:hypothetical protein
MLEREVKLGAGPAFHLPDLNGVVDGVTVTPPEVVRLETVYYDTPLSLSPSGRGPAEGCAGCWLRQPGRLKGGVPPFSRRGAWTGRAAGKG